MGYHIKGFKGGYLLDYRLNHASTSPLYTYIYIYIIIHIYIIYIYIVATGPLAGHPVGHCLLQSI